MYPPPKNVEYDRDGSRFITIATLTQTEINDGITVHSDGLTNGSAHFKVSGPSPSGTFQLSGTMREVITQDIPGGLIDASTPKSTDHWVGGVDEIHVKGSVSGVDSVTILIERW